MNKADIVKAIAGEMELSDKDAIGIVNHVVESLKIIVKEHGRLELRGFGVFQVKQRKPRIGRNPRTSMEYPIAPRKGITFKAGMNLKVLPKEKRSSAPLPVFNNPRRRGPGGNQGAGEEATSLPTAPPKRRAAKKSVDPSAEQPSETKPVKTLRDTVVVEQLTMDDLFG